MEKVYKILIFGTVVFSLLILGVFYKSDTYNIFPFNEDQNIYLGTYHEPLNDNYSEGTFVVEEGKLKINYQLGKGSMEPFIGFYIQKKNVLDSFFDFEGFNEIRLHIRAKSAARIPLTYTINYKGYTNPLVDLTNIPFTSVIDYKEPGWYNVKLGAFEKQSWWFRELKKKEEDFPNISLERVNYFVIGSCQVLGQGGEDEIIVSNIELGNDNSLLILFWILITAVSVIIIVLLGIRKKEKVVVPVVGNELKVEENSNLELIVNYIAKHYTNPELTKEDLQSELGITSRQIGTELKEGLNSSVKNYLNQIRLAEVKRLLRESDLPISDIAYKCGYNNISHFNRVFKTDSGISPKQYREKA